MNPLYSLAYVGYVSLHSAPCPDFMQAPAFTPIYRLVRIAGDGIQPARDRGCYWATVLEARELLCDTLNDASTKLVRFDIGNVSSCRNGGLHRACQSVLETI